MAAVELVLDVARASSDVLPPPHTQHATAAVVSLEPTASVKSVSHRSSVENDVHVKTLLPTDTFHPSGRSTHDGSTFTDGAGVVVTLVGDGVVELVNGSGDDVIASVELEYSGVGTSVGVALGAAEGTPVGAIVGVIVAVPGVGGCVGGALSSSAVGGIVGDDVLVGAEVGDADVGAEEGTAVGAAEGTAVGVRVGVCVGAAEGARLGAADGAVDGAADGAAVGASTPVVPPPQ